jgi:hypothetical protein
MVVLFLVISISQLAFSDYHPTFSKYSTEAYQLASKIDTLKEKYHLKHKSYEDLLETCSYITTYSQYSKFDKYEVSAIVLKEAKFDQFAFNKNDGGIGLGQITGLKKGWHDDTLFWMTDPWNKEQNIRGIYFLLSDNLHCYKTKFNAIKRYNGKTVKSKRYAEHIGKLKQEIKAAKI